MERGTANSLLTAQYKALTQGCKVAPVLAACNTQSEQVVLKRTALAFAPLLARQMVEESWIPAFKGNHRYPGWGYKTRGDGWKLHSGKNGKPSNSP